MVGNTLATSVPDSVFKYRIHLNRPDNLPILLSLTGHGLFFTKHAVIRTFNRRERQFNISFDRFRLAVSNLCTRQHNELMSARGNINRRGVNRTLYHVATKAGAHPFGSRTADLLCDIACWLLVPPGSADDPD